jgi:hypothetical protein
MKFRIGFLRQFKLNRLKEIRQVRDELIYNCNNIGRAERLLHEFPGVVSTKTGYCDSFQLRRSITIRMDTGHTYQFDGYGDYLQGFKDVGKFIYDLWAKDELDYGNYSH